MTNQWTGFYMTTASIRKELKWGKMKKNIESNIFFEVQKYYFVFESMLKYFFKWSYSQGCFDVAQRCENRRWKWQRCFDVVQRCSVQRWETQRCFNVVLRCKFPRWHTQRCFNIDLALCDVTTSYQPKINVESTLKCLLGCLSIHFVNIFAYNFIASYVHFHIQGYNFSFEISYSNFTERCFALSSCCNCIMIFSLIRALGAYFISKL